MQLRALLALASLVPLLLTGCSSGPTADEQFARLANHYLDRTRELNPEWSTNLGDHRFDTKLSDWSAGGVQARLELNHAYADSLAALEVSDLSQDNRIDCEILSNAIASELFGLEELREYEWVPQMYADAIGNGLNNLLAREFAPLSERLASVKGRLEDIPKFLEAARSNLTSPPHLYTQKAISKNRGNIRLVMDDLQDWLDEAPELEDEFVAPRARAIAALTDFGDWMERELLPRSDGDFRVGAEIFRRKLRFTLSSDLSPEEIIAAAQKDLEKTQRKMYETALPLYREFFPGREAGTPKEVCRAVLDRLADDHPTNDVIVAQARGCLDRATKFVRQKNLVTVPDDPVSVIEMPEYQRGFAIAYCDAPGPLEEGAETFFSISPTPVNSSPELIESHFREYNDYMLENLSIHEAMPGHYLQLAHSNSFEGSTMVRAIYGSGTFIEGWATYAEQLMAEQGYGGPRVRMQQLKMRLRLIINSMLDWGIHAEGMTRREAIALMTDDGYQEQGEAVGKWDRACQSSTQLSTYYVGNLEINALRHDYREREAEAFDLKVFHDELLSYGSPPSRCVRELMGL